MLTGAFSFLRIPLERLHGVGVRRWGADVADSAVEPLRQLYRTHPPHGEQHAEAPGTFDKRGIAGGTVAIHVSHPHVGRRERSLPPAPTPNRCPIHDGMVAGRRGVYRRVRAVAGFAAASPNTQLTGEVITLAGSVATARVHICPPSSRTRNRGRIFRMNAIISSRCSHSHVRNC